MKAYYITYGIFTSDLDQVVKKIEDIMGIKLIKDGYSEDHEIYYLDSESSDIIKDFSFIRADSSGYHINNTEILYPYYLISCNIIVEDFDIESLESVMQLIDKQSSIKKINMDTDEW